MRSSAAGLVAVLACLLASAPASAQTDTLQVRRSQLLQRVPPGTTVRVLLDGGEVVGRLARAANDTLFLEQRAVPMSAIRNVWLQQRATRTGAKWGAIIGAPAGAAFGTFVLYLVSALCESDCSDFGTGEFVIGVLGFGAAGLLAGGAIGAVIGAGAPQWVEITSSRARLPDAAATARSANRTMGSISLTPALAYSSSGDDSGLGARLSYAFQTRHVSVGPELGWYSLGTLRRTLLFPCETGVCPATFAETEKVFHVGGIARVGTGAYRRFEPYASLGGGLYSWTNDFGGSTALGGYSAGAGIQLRNRTGRRSLLIEGRWQSNLTRSGDAERQFGFYTIGVGGALAW